MSFLRPFLFLNILYIFTVNSLFSASSDALEKLCAATALAKSQTDGNDSDSITDNNNPILLENFFNFPDTLEELKTSSADHTLTDTPLPALLILEPKIGFNVQGKRIFICQNCNQDCLCKSAFDTHLRIHTKEKPYLCTTCNPPKNFSRRSHLNEHRKIHTGEKPFHCDTCKQTFSQLSNLKSHLRLRIGHKPYQPKCTKGLPPSNSLKSRRKKYSFPIAIYSDEESEPDYRKKKDDIEYDAATLSAKPPLHHLPQIVSLATQQRTSVQVEMDMPPYSDTFDEMPITQPSTYQHTHDQDAYRSSLSATPIFISPYPFCCPHPTKNH